MHESNAIPGKVTRLLGKFCDYVALGISSTSDYLPGCRTIFTGTPVRSDFYLEHHLPNWVPTGEGVLIVIMGGSQGAIKMNEMVRNIQPWLINKACRVVHLTGKTDCFYRNLDKYKNHPNFVVRHFSDEIPALLQNADIVISRAGAGAISELTVTKTPSILIPFPNSTDYHQEFNAAYMARLGGAVIVNQHNPEKKILKNIISKLIDSTSLAQMKLNMNNIDCHNVENKIFEIINSIN